MSLDVDIDPLQSFPLLRSGKVTFSNLAPPNHTVEIDCANSEVRVDDSPPKALSEYGVPYVLMDTGASGTLIPSHFAQALGIEEPPADENHWLVITGVAGIMVGFIPVYPVNVELRGKYGETCQTDIYPIVQVCLAPSFSATRDHMEDFPKRALWPKAIVKAVSVPFSIHPDGFDAQVTAPTDECPILCKRGRLIATCEHKQFQTPILIGRDWQRKHRLIFQDRVMRIA